MLDVRVHEKCSNDKTLVAKRTCPDTNIEQGGCGGLVCIQNFVSFHSKRFVVRCTEFRMSQTLCRLNNIECVERDSIEIRIQLEAQRELLFPKEDLRPEAYRGDAGVSRWLLLKRVQFEKQPDLVAGRPREADRTV